MNELTLQVKPRDQHGKNASRRLRAAGVIPAIVYGEGGEPISIQVDNREIQAILRSSGENPVFLLELEGTEQKRHTMIRELQVDPTNGKLVHIDFQRVAMDRKVKVGVPIVVVGTAEGVRNEGGMLDFVTRTLEVECLPGDIPPGLEVNVEALHVGQHLEAKDVALPTGVELVDEPQRVILSIAAGRLAAEAAEEGEAELLETEAAEPEVIGRGKEDEEEG